MENKPFIFGVATSGDNFTDREKETERLLLNFRHGVNTVLISPRRWGKTSLVQKVCSLAQSDELKVVYLDIFSCRSDKDFYDAFATAVLKQTSSKLEDWLENMPCSVLPLWGMPMRIRENLQRRWANTGKKVSVCFSMGN